VNIVFLDNYYYLALIPVLVGIFVYTTLLMGVWRRHRLLLLPYIVYQILYLISMLVLLVLCTAWLISPPKSDCAPTGSPLRYDQLLEFTTKPSTIHTFPQAECRDTTAEDTRFISFLLVVTITTMCLHFWYLLVIVRFYVFLTDYEIHRSNTGGRRVHYMQGDIRVYPASALEAHFGPAPPYPANEAPALWIAPPAYEGVQMPNKETTLMEENATPTHSTNELPPQIP